MKQINQTTISISAVSALAAVNSFFAISNVDASSNQTKVANNKNVESKAKFSKKSLFRINANLNENAGKPYRFSFGIFKPISIEKQSSSFFDSSVGFNYEEITNNSSQSINQSKTGLSTSFILGKRNAINDNWIGGINFGLLSRSINYYSPRTFTSGVVQFEFLSNKLNVIPYGNFSLTNKKLINTTSSSVTTTSNITTTNDNLFLNPINKYGIEIERKINDQLSVSLDSFYINNYPAGLRDGFGMGFHFSYSPWGKTKIRNGVNYDPIYNTNLNAEIEYKFNYDSLENYDARLIKTPNIRDIQFEIYNESTTDTESRFIDLSAASINLGIPLESPIKTIAEDLVNFEETQTA